MQLVKKFISCCAPVGSFADVMVYLQSLKPGRHLSGDHVLDLFEFCAANP
jgi:hypothetical protein